MKLALKLEQRRIAKRRQLFDAQDNIDKKRSELTEGIERQIETAVKCESVFIIRWAITDIG